MNTITITKLPESNRYLATVDGVNGECYIDYAPVGDNLISANHTWADPILRGSGVAPKLVDYMIEDARENNFQVLAVCPYIVQLYHRHPDWQDVVVSL